MLAPGPNPTDCGCENFGFRFCLGTGYSVMTLGMKPVKFQRRDGALSHAGKAVSLLAVLLIMAVMYLSASPESHETFHKDADHGDHECVITAFSAGEGLYTAPQIVVRPEVVVIQRVEVTAKEVAQEALRNLLPPVCGPPARSLNT